MVIWVGNDVFVDIMLDNFCKNGIDIIYVLCIDVSFGVVLIFVDLELCNFIFIIKGVNV